MRTPLQSTLAALLLLGAAGCGGDDTATKTVTVAGETETVTSPQDAVSYTHLTLPTICSV